MNEDSRLIFTNLGIFESIILESQGLMDSFLEGGRKSKKLEGRF